MYFEGIDPLFDSRLEFRFGCVGGFLYVDIDAGGEENGFGPQSPHLAPNSLQFVEGIHLIILFLATRFAFEDPQICTTNTTGIQFVIGGNG